LYRYRQSLVAGPSDFFLTSAKSRTSRQQEGERHGSCNLHSLSAKVANRAGDFLSPPLTLHVLANYELKIDL